MKLTIPRPAKIWAGRVAAAVLAAVVDALQHGRMPHNTGDALALISGAVVAATPVLHASGLLRPAGNGAPSLAQKAVAAVQAILKSPAEKRKQAFAALVAPMIAQAESAGWEAGKTAAEKTLDDLLDERLRRTGAFKQTPAGLVPIDEVVPEKTPPAPETKPENEDSGTPSDADDPQEVITEELPKQEGAAVA